MTKTVMCIKEGDTIPENSLFLKSERLCTKNEQMNCDCPVLLGCDCRDIEYTTFFYYEVIND